MMKCGDHNVYVRPGFSPSLKWAAFLDRDGVLNEEVHLLHKPEDMRLIPNAAQAVRLLNEKKIPVIVAHNAAVVSRGICSPEQEESLNQLLIEMLAKQGAVIDALYSCPHHPSAFKEDFRKDCDWRKPRPGMLTHAATHFDLDLKNSHFVGDSGRDVQAARTAGVRSYLVRTGHAGKDLLFDAPPDETCADVLDAVHSILRMGITA